MEFTSEEFAQLNEFLKQFGKDFPGTFSKHESPQGDNFWFYRPHKGIGGTSCKFGTLDDFLQSLTHETRPVPTAAPQAAVLAS